jgi:hypothetical protein
VVAHYKYLKVKMSQNHFSHPTLSFLVLLTGILSSIINHQRKKVLKRKKENS